MRGEFTEDQEKIFHLAIQARERGEKLIVFYPRHSYKSALRKFLEYNDIDNVEIR